MRHSTIAGHTKYTNNKPDIRAQITLQQSQVLPPLCWSNKENNFSSFQIQTGGESTDYGLYITDRAESSASQTEIFWWSTMFLGLLVISLLASKAGITLFIRSILVLLLGPSVSPIEFSLQELGIINEKNIQNMTSLSRLIIWLW